MKLSKITIEINKSLPFFFQQLITLFAQHIYFPRHFNLHCNTNLSDFRESIGGQCKAQTAYKWELARLTVYPMMNTESLW